MRLSLLLLPISILAVLPVTAGITPHFRQAGAVLGTTSLRHVWSSADGQVQAFNRTGGGFALTTPAGVVGYSDSGTFSPQAAPAALIEILENVRPSASLRAVSSYTPVAPLLGNIAWDQTDPYNLLCPTYYGSQRSATGCAATAMAQIMRYHRYPAHGYGSNTYTPEFYPEMGALTVDFSQSAYDWDNMLPVYTAGASEVENLAVARLMYDAGVAVSMNYGPVSGAMSQDWPASLTEYFGYDKGVALLYRAYYDVDSWVGIIHDELEAGRPVYVTGFTDAGGHAFVFDGMDAAGMVHVNWGWSGMSNGYFSTSWLTPSTQGTGGSNGGFNARQMMVTRIQPPAEGSEPAVTLVSEEALTVTPRRAATGTAITVKLNGKVENVGWQTTTVDFGLALTDASGNVVAEVDGPAGIEIVPGTAHRTVVFNDVNLGSLADGSYTLYPMAGNSGSSHRERIRDKDLAFPNYLLLTVSGSEMAFSAPEMAGLTASRPELDGNLYAGLKARVTTELTNNGGTEYMGTVALALFDAASGHRVFTTETYTTDIMPGQTTDMELLGIFDIAPGEYNLAIVDNTGRSISEMLPVSVAEVSLMGITALSAPDFGTNDAVDPLSVQATARVSAPEGCVFSGQLFLYIYEADGTKVHGCLGPEFVQVTGADDARTVTFTGPFENAVPDAEYDACLVNGEDFTYVTPRDAATTRIRIAGGASIGAPEADAVPGDTRYYSIQGTPLAGAPAIGPYIKVTAGKAVKVFNK